MQTGFISMRQAPSNKRKVMLIAFIGTIALVAGMFAIFYPKTTAGSVQFVDDNGVDSAIATAFGRWTTKYNRVYLTEAERAFRMKIFQENFYKIKKITDEGHSYTVGLNKFADMTKDEFRAQYLSRRGTSKPAGDRAETYLPEGNAPEKIDWREKGAVTPVKDQGFCGSCWAFSAVGAIESLHFIKKGSLQRLSEQQVVDCSWDYGNQGCGGGFEYYGMEYVTDNGIELEKDYPYKAQDLDCKYDKTKVFFQTTGHTHVPKDNSDQLAEAVATQPVSVAVEADGDSFMFYTGGVLDDASCGTYLNHAILAVGYDDKADKPHWIVKNSWSDGWGEDGYIRIAKTHKKGPGICGIANDPSYPNYKA